MDSKTAFFERELTALTERNITARNGLQELKKSKPIVVACMDERNTLTEEALGLNPFQVTRLATGGGMIDANDFLSIYSDRLSGEGKGNEILLVTHEVVGKNELGCAAFKCDMPAQEKYFCRLKKELAQNLPGAIIHVVSMDTSTGGLRGIDIDERDEEFKMFAERGGAPRIRCMDESHGGYGIYVGEAYRAWNSLRNRYFHISAVAPSLLNDLNIAISVITGHSDVDLSDKTIVLHLDTPKGGAVDSLIAAKADKAVQELLKQPNVAEMLDSGEMQIVRTTTDLHNWNGTVMESSLESAIKT